MGFEISVEQYFFLTYGKIIAQHTQHINLVFQTDSH